MKTFGAFKSQVDDELIPRTIDAIVETPTKRRIRKKPAARKPPAAPAESEAGGEASPFGDDAFDLPGESGEAKKAPARPAQKKPKAPEPAGDDDAPFEF